MTSVSHFIGDKLLMGGFAIALASGISQAEAFSGDCGLYPNRFHILLVFAQCAAFVFAVGLLLGCNKLGVFSKQHMQTGIVGVYVLVAMITHGYNIPFCDLLLVQGGVFNILGWNDITGKLLIANILFSAAASKFMNTDCDGSWFSFNSLKSDAFNQPFPFTPVWHIAQLPNMVVQTISVCIVLSEVLLPFALLVSRKSTAMESASSTGIIGLGLFYALIGNFNWSIMVLMSWVVRYVPSDVCVLILGQKIFIRWGLADVVLHEDVAEEKLIRSLVASAKLIVVFIMSCLCLKIVWDNDLSLIKQDLVPYSIILPAALWSVTVFTLNRIAGSSMRHVLFALAVLISTRTEWVSIMSLGQVSPLVDYSGLPTCYTFRGAGDDFPVHSKKGRAAFLFQTKYSQMGTNTIGSDLGGIKYAELSVPGSVHADEQRPPFLLGHLPRLALTIWKMGTGNESNIEDGLVLMDRLATVVREGSDAIRVFFPNTPDSIIEAHIGRTNQIQAFYQEYTVTSRAADHQWWKRSYEKVSALPSSDILPVDPVRVRCSVVLPPKILDVPLELILIMAVLVLVCAKILFSSNQVKTGGVAKKKSK